MGLFFGEDKTSKNGRILREKWCPGAELNHRHADFQSAALPTELSGHRDDLFYRIIKIKPKKLMLI